jgi:hypothetical protein
VSVLHLGTDETIGFEYLDGGAVWLLGAPGDVRAGRWERPRVEVQSG